MSNTTTDNAPKAGDDQDLGAAGSQLSTAPKEEQPNLPSLGLVGWARWFWRQLTSMRVALLLLLLLSLGAIPGSLIPQTGIDETKVAAFREQHDILAPVYDKLGLFNVYSSVWFSAIYILLFVSLIGCIVPRTWQFVGQLRGRPPGAPRRLTRLPAHTTWRTEAEPEQVREAALALLRRRRFRAHVVGDAVAAEKGYLREVGNLVFHVALIVMLIAFAWGQLFKYEGNKLIVEGGGFANTLTQYDDFRSGNLFTEDDLDPFSFDLVDFKATYEPTGPNRGTPRTYEADLTYSVGAYGDERRTTVKVNEPLEIDGSKVYLVSHGYAPVLTVKDASGKVVMDKEAVALLPLDGNVTSSGAVKVMDGYRNADGEREQLGFNAFFLPTYGGEGSTMLSVFPALINPMLALSAYHGDLGVDAGTPQSIYQLDKTNMEEFKDSDGKLFKKQLALGETMTLPNGAGTVTFEGVKEWAGFQMVQEPGGGWALGGAVAAIAGLAGSLFIQRRRVWVRAVRGADGVTVVEMAGLGRSESAKVPEELGDLAGLLYDKAPGAPEPEGSEEADGSDDSDNSADSGESGDPDRTDPRTTGSTDTDTDTDTEAVPAEGAEQQ
ncbi:MULTISPECIES: cytochrome c biogenesis protein ResB [unclassified Streptomyces]|uniref:cytochrome c biogenesis protein ResB n=1 Tax=unclassified Streptomyces TaxID=2593676 RepID=UPI000AE8794B|nr:MULTISPECIES: cytochrome c biogenesis protein ResB [unclassified Streptomyces]AZM60730.1 cytochrome C biogenesis protein [Streptomyces sp. WAC 01438]RSM89228.1 cytochrome C biogenesis protein [Streptomyces sp. WAC 01420]